MALSEIEKLERRYAENPQGLTFAPLAEVHRKNGDVTRALELLKPGLTLHPDYIPASIVLGRCHLDLGDLPAAEAAFTHVLGLDGENVIALKALADITERQYRFDEAERWLRTLLAIDRSNDEARDQLGRVEASRRQAETASSASPDAALATMPEVAEAAPPEALLGTTEAEAEPGAMSLPPMPEPPRDTMLAWVEGSGGITAAEEASPLELEELDLAAGKESAPPEGIQLEESVTLDEPVERLPGLVGRDDGASHTDGDGLSDAWAIETSEDIVLESADGSEFRVANAAEELLSTRYFSEPEPLVREGPAVERGEVPLPVAHRADEPVAEAADEQPVAASDPASPEPAPVPTPETAPHESQTPAFASWAAPVAEPPRRPEPDLVVTESMAELLVQQGHTAEALTVYRHLESRTADARFRDKIAALESPPAPAVPPPASEPVATPEPAAAAAPTPSYSVRETHGESVQSFLRGVLGGRLAAAPPGPAGHAEPSRGAPESATGGAPTRPAHDSLSLSSVFGEESTPTPPAVPAAGPAPAGQGGVSYDEFFSGAGGAPRPPRAPDPKSDDLDQFHAWLQNLKR